MPPHTSRCSKSGLVLLYYLSDGSCFFGPSPLPDDKNNFFRIHNGLGLLLARKHLNFLLTSPMRTHEKSAFYVMPKEVSVSNKEFLDRVVGKIDENCFVVAREKDGILGYRDVNGLTEWVDENNDASLLFLHFVTKTVHSFCARFDANYL